MRYSLNTSYNNASLLSPILLKFEYIVGIDYCRLLFGYDDSHICHELHVRDFLYLKNEVSYRVSFYMSYNNSCLFENLTLWWDCVMGLNILKNWAFFNMSHNNSSLLSWILLKFYTLLGLMIDDCRLPFI